MTEHHAKNVTFSRALKRLLCVACLASLLPAASAPDPLEIIRQSVEQDQINWKKARDYTFIQREEMKIFGAKGKLKDSESNTYEVVIIERLPFRRKIAHNGELLEGKEKRKAQKAFEKQVRKKLGRNEKEREKKIARLEEERRKEHEFLLDIPKAFNFELVGEETVNERPAWVIDADPRPDFRPGTKEAKRLSKFRGRLWIDQKDCQWVKAEAESTDSIGIGWFVARLGKGARVSFHNRLVNDEIWLPEQITFSGALRLMLVARFNGEVRVDFSDYRKFQADSRIVTTDIFE